MAWIIQSDQLINDECINDGTKPCVGDSPYTMWRIDPNDNGCIPYIPLMIGVPNIINSKLKIGNNTVIKAYLGDIPASKIYYGDVPVLY